MYVGGQQTASEDINDQVWFLIVAALAVPITL
jgi:hypothetical protein